MHYLSLSGGGLLVRQGIAVLISADRRQLPQIAPEKSSGRMCPILFTCYERIFWENLGYYVEKG